REDQATFFRGCDRKTNKLLTFLVGQRRRFACGTYSNHSVDSRRDLVFDQFRESSNINPAIAKWRYKSREGAAKHVLNVKKLKRYEVKMTHSTVMSSEVETSLITSR